MERTKMNNYDYILKLLNFQDKNLEIVKIDFIDNIYYIYVNKKKILIFLVQNVAECQLLKVLHILELLNIHL